MICLYDIGNTNYSNNGDMIMTPTECTIKHVAGGEYSFTMKHPFDENGRWQKIVREAIVKLPVPTETIENSYSGMEAWVYAASTDLVLRDSPSEPSSISYNQWISGGNYSAGSTVSNNGKNYRCRYYDDASAVSLIDPADTSWWTEIPTSTPGGAVVASVKANEDLYWVSGSTSDTWWKMSTYYGLQGYCKQSQLTNERHFTPSQNQPRIIKNQLFRIKTVNLKRQEGYIEIYGTHVSNDLSGVLVDEVNLVNVPVDMAIGRIMDRFMIDYQGMIATNLSSYETYTQEIKGKNALYCLLDKDSGIVPATNAKFTVDNWDLFVMRQTTVDRGYTIRAGKNVKGITWSEDTENLITRIVPVAKDAGGELLYLPEKWVDSSYISSYPVIYMERLMVKGQVGKPKNEDKSEVWTESDLLDEMRTKAGERYSIDLVDRVLTEVTVDLEPLENTAEYESLKSLENVSLYDTVLAIDTVLGKRQELIVSELEYDAIRQVVRGVKLTNNMNTSNRTVTGYDIANASISAEKLKDSVRDDLITEVVEIMPQYAG